MTTQLSSVSLHQTLISKQQ